jgi:hypothetical protein
LTYAARIHPHEPCRVDSPRAHEGAIPLRAPSDCRRVRDRRAALPLTSDFHILNLCLDNAIAEAVTEYARQREQNTADEEVERLGFLAHELRNLISTATMAFQVLRGGTVAIGGSTGAVLERSLRGLRDVVDRSLAEVSAARP